MSYFNKKEQVLDIKLTQYGKHLLSIGKLNPTYYRFFDDDVLYDGAYANISESQNDISERIVNNTPHKRTQHNHVGVETELNRDYNARQKPYTVAEFTKVNILSTPEREYVLYNDLGESSMGEDKAPRFKLQFLRGEVESFSRFLTSSYQDLPIPQVAMDLIYKTEVSDFNDGSGLKDTDPELASPLFDDGTAIIVQTDHILGLIVEDNISFEKNNFEIEVFEIIDVSGSSGTKLDQELRALSFARNRKPAIVDGILLDKEDIKMDDFPLTPNHVEYFFDVLVDDEISEGVLCAEAAKIKPESLFVDLPINCPDLPFTNIIADPYSSEIDLQKATVCNDDGEVS